MKLNEVMNTQVNFNWTAWESDYREARFESNGLEYKVTFTVDGEEDDEDEDEFVDGTDQHEWQMLTKQEDGTWTTQMTGQGNALGAFGGTVQVVSAYQQKANPTEMMYTMSDNSESRLKFYNSLAKRFAKIGFSMSTKVEGGVKFWLMRK